MRIAQNKRGLIVNKEYSRLPYMTDEGYDEIQRSTSQKFVQDNYGKFDESENQQSYKVDSEYDDGYQGLEYDYSLPGFNSGLGNIDIDPAEATDKDISCDGYWNQLFPGHPTGSGPFIPDSGDLSVLNIYAKKCPVEYKYHICCGRGLRVQGPVNGELESEQNYKFDVGNKPLECDYNFWAKIGTMWNDGRYTAPYTETEITDTMGVTARGGLSLNKDCLTWKVKIKPKTDVCLGRVAVTAPTMAAGASQTLTVQGWVAGEVYSWSTTTGSLDVATGNSAVYTAPASNANCASNPTITLSCGGSVVQTIQIAINAVTSGGVGIMREYLSQGSCWKSGDAWHIWNICANVYTLSCNGTVTFHPEWSPACSDGVGNSCDAAFADGESRVIRGSIDQTGYCYYQQGVKFGDWCDSRSAEQKTAGCCPAQLL